MLILTFDNTFQGFLSVVFTCYAEKLTPHDILPSDHFQEKLFAQIRHIDTNIVHAERVWKGLRKKLNRRAQEMPFRIFLSEIPEAYIRLYKYIRRVFDQPENIDNDWGDPNVMELRKLDREVTREAMRMLQFIRFEKTKDHIYFAPIEPRHNVIPLIINHFKSRFADQQWLIYDLKRDYGIFFDLNKVEEITLDNKQFDEVKGRLNANVVMENEATYQRLWKKYFESVNIKERCNKKLQRQHMPQRFWKFLPEK